MNTKTFSSRVCASLLALSCGYSVPAATVTSADGKVTIDVPSGENYTLSTADATTLTGLDLHKTGEGRLVISTDLKSMGWDGEIVVEAGYLRTTLNGALGGVTKGTVIKPGATLEIEDNSESYAQIHPEEPFSIGGSGVDGLGAVYAINRGKSIGTNMMFGKSKVTLTSDTVVGYSGTEGFDGTCGFRGATLYMDNHTLTFKKGSNHGFFGGAIKNPGRINVEAGRQLIIENEVDLGNKPNNTLWLGEGATLVLRNEGKSPSDITRPGWRIETEGAATLKKENADECSWYGPIHLGGNLAVKGNTLSKLTFRGAISGSGSIVVDSGIVDFDNKTETQNSYAGRFVHNAGTSSLTGISSIPSLPEGGLTGVKGAVSVSATQNDEITDDMLYGIWQGVTTNATQPASSKPSNYDLATHRDALFDFKLGLARQYVFRKSISSPITIYHGGADSSLEIASEMTGLPNLINYAGTLTLSGDTTKNASWLDVRGGTVEIAEGARLNLTSNAYVCANYPDVARLKIRGSYTHAAAACGTRLGRNLASGYKCGRGIMEILDGAVVEEAFPVSSSSAAASFVPNGWGDDERLDQGHASSMGSYYQRGGTFRTAMGKENYWGTYFANYYSLEDGLLHLRQTTRVAGYKSSRVVIHQRGGTCYVENSGFNSACAGCQVVHYISGGVFAITNSQYTAVRIDSEERYTKSGYGALAVLAIDGRDALCDLHTPNENSLNLAGQDYSRGQLNLLSGGTLRGNGISKYLAAVFKKDGATVSKGLEGNVADVAFDGGVMEMACQLSSKKIFRDFSGPDDHVRVFGGGATIDCGTADWTLGAPLEAPEGNGVESIALPEDIANAVAWEFTAAPTVEIVDPTGVGTGATAVAIFDTVEGKVTGIKVLNRGSNYASAQATISRGGQANKWTVDASVSPNQSGGLTKKGSGMLTVDNVCTYTGATCVAGGTLKIGVDGAVDASSCVVLSGGTLDAGFKSFNVPISGGAGAVIGTESVNMAADMVFDARQMLAGSPISVDGVVNIPDGATVSVRNFDAVGQTSKRKFKIIAATGGIVGNIPSIDVELAKDGWSIVVSPDGKEMFVYKPKGLKVIFR